MHANNREEIKKPCTGDIAALIGMKDVTTGIRYVTAKMLLFSNVWSSLSL